MSLPFFTCSEIPDKLREMNFLLSITNVRGGKRKEKVDLISEKEFISRDTDIERASSGTADVAFPFSRGSSQARDQTQVSPLQADSLLAEPQRKPKNTGVRSLSALQQIFPTQESNLGLEGLRKTAVEI